MNDIHSSGAPEVHVKEHELNSHKDPGSHLTVSLLELTRRLNGLKVLFNPTEHNKEKNHEMSLDMHASENV